MFSVKAKPTPTMPAYTMPSRTPSSSARRHQSSRSRNRPLLASSVTGAPTSSMPLSEMLPANPPTPSSSSAMAVATNTPHSSPPASRRRGSGS